MPLFHNNPTRAGRPVDIEVDMTESFAQLLEESFSTQKIKPGSILTGIVVGVSPDMVIVHAGLKSEAVIPAEQFYNERGELDVKVGDHVEVALDTVEDGFGETRLSREKAKRTRTWTRLEESFQKGEIVKRHDQRAGPRRVHRRHRSGARVLAGFARRRPPDP